MAKRANGEGTLVPRRNQSGRIIGWKAAVTVGYTNGKPDRRWVSGKTQDVCRERAERLKSDRNQGTLPDADRLSIGLYLERWLEHKRPLVKTKTFSGYERLVKQHLRPRLGHIRLDKLRPLEIEHALGTLREAHGVGEARRARTVFSMALTQAVRWLAIPRNPCLAVKPPPLPDSDDETVHCWTPKEAARFLEFVRGHRLYALFYLGLMSGMRPGELLGLRWKDVHLSGGFIKVRQNAVDVNGKMELGTPKTKASRRTITISPDTVTAIEAHRDRQAEERVALEHPTPGALRRRQVRERAYSENEFVFASEVGTVTGYHNLRRAFKTLIAQLVVKSWQEAGLIEATETRSLERHKEILREQPELAARTVVNNIGLHGLRHTHASVLIRRGVPPKVVSDRLGHTSVAFTLKVYAHLFEEQRLEAAIGIEDFLGSSTSMTVFVPVEAA